MTNEEAIACLKFEKSGCRNFYEYADMDEILDKASSEVGWMTKAIDMAIKALERRDKYRWHDLRKNPDDLPEDDGGDVIVCVESLNSSGKRYCMHSKRFVNAMKDSYHPTIVAWKEIEPFEGEGK